MGVATSAFKNYCCCNADTVLLHQPVVESNPDDELLNAFPCPLDAPRNFFAALDVDFARKHSVGELLKSHPLARQGLSRDIKERIWRHYFQRKYKKNSPNIVSLRDSKTKNKNNKKEIENDKKDKQKKNEKMNNQAKEKEIEKARKTAEKYQVANPPISKSEQITTTKTTVNAKLQPQLLDSSSTPKPSALLLPTGKAPAGPPCIPISPSSPMSHNSCLPPSSPTSSASTAAASSSSSSSTSEMLTPDLISHSLLAMQYLLTDILRFDYLSSVTLYFHFKQRALDRGVVWNPDSDEHARRLKREIWRLKNLPLEHMARLLVKKMMFAEEEEERERKEVQEEKKQQAERMENMLMNMNTNQHTDTQETEPRDPTTTMGLTRTQTNTNTNTNPNGTITRTNAAHLLNHHEEKIGSQSLGERDRGSSNHLHHADGPSSSTLDPASSSSSSSSSSSPVPPNTASPIPHNHHTLTTNLGSASSISSAVPSRQPLVSSPFSPIDTIENEVTRLQVRIERAALSGSQLSNALDFDHFRVYFESAFYSLFERYYRKSFWLLFVLNLMANFKTLCRAEDDASKDIVSPATAAAVTGVATASINPGAAGRRTQLVREENKVQTFVVNATPHNSSLPFNSTLYAAYQQQLRPAATGHTHSHTTHSGQTVHVIANEPAMALLQLYRPQAMTAQQYSFTHSPTFNEKSIGIGIR